MVKSLPMRFFKDNKGWWLVAAALVLLLFAAQFLLRTSLWTFILYFCFLLLFVFLPGYFFARMLSPKNSSECYGLALAIGICIPIVSYMLFVPIGFRLGVAVLPVLLGLAGAVFLIQDIRKRQTPVLDFDARILAIILFVLLLNTVILAFSGLSPAILGRVILHPDNVWNISDIACLRKGYPPPELRMYGQIFTYHHFSFLFRAVINMLTQIDIDKIFFALSMFVTVPCTIFNLDALGRRFLGSRNRAVLFIVLFYTSTSASALFFARGVGEYFLNTFIIHLFSIPNGVDFALPLLLALGLIIIKIWAGEFTRAGVAYLSFCLLAFCCTGVKGPFGVVLFGTVVGMLCFRLLQKKRRTESAAVWLAVLGVICFIVPYYFILSESGENPARTIAVSPGFSITVSEIWTRIILPLLPDNLPRAAAMALPVLLIPLHFLGCLPFAAIPYVGFIVSQLKQAKTCPPQNIMLLGMSGGGIAAFYFFLIEGSGQMYFLYAAMAFIWLAALCWLYQYRVKFKHWFKAMLAVCLAVSCLSSAFAYISIAKDGAQNIYHIITRSGYNDEGDYNALTVYEYDAMIWLRENSDTNAIVATHRHYNSEEISADSARYFYYSAYSQRQMFVEAWSYLPRTEAVLAMLDQRVRVNEMLFAPDTPNRAEIMRDNGISYLVVSRFICPDLSFTDEGLSLVFSNRDIDIYQLQEAPS